MEKGKELICESDLSSAGSKYAWRKGYQGCVPGSVLRKGLGPEHQGGEAAVQSADGREEAVRAACGAGAKLKTLQAGLPPGGCNTSVSGGSGAQQGG